MFKQMTYPLEHSSVYPGEYEPLPREAKELSDRLKRRHCVTNPPVNVKAYPEHYIVEMPAPGFKREDFYITTNGMILFISATKISPTEDRIGHGFQGFNYNCLQRDVILPEDVDTEFSTAGYVDGILRIGLFRSMYPVVNGIGHIMVY